jgi:hypothetical protein
MPISVARSTRASGADETARFLVLCFTARLEPRRTFRKNCTRRGLRGGIPERELEVTDGLPRARRCHRDSANRLERTGTNFTPGPDRTSAMAVPVAPLIDRDSSVIRTQSGNPRSVFSWGRRFGEPGKTSRGRGRPRPCWRIRPICRQVTTARRRCHLARNTMHARTLPGGGGMRRVIGNSLRGRAG